MTTKRRSPGRVRRPIPRKKYPNPESVFAISFSLDHIFWARERAARQRCDYTTKECEWNGFGY